jgi:hypothetical protein
MAEMSQKETPAQRQKLRNATKFSSVKMMSWKEKYQCQQMCSNKIWVAGQEP